MILDILTKFNCRRKIFLTPEHPFCSYSTEFKVMYTSAVTMQAKLNRNIKPLNNFELERLMKYGLKMNSGDIAWTLRNLNEYETVFEYILDNLKTGEEKIIFLMDLVNVAMADNIISPEENEFALKFALQLGISENIYELIKKYIVCAFEDNAGECFELAKIIKNLYPKIEFIDLKYFALQIYESVECTQREINEKKEVRITDRCQIYDDIVLKSGTKLVFDHALVRIYGNILLDGGTLEIINSKFIRKSDSHRACINVKDDYSRVLVQKCEADCRNYGMFIRAEAGEVSVKDSNIYHTTRGAAIRFWGKRLDIESSSFSRCYSPEDGGAVLARGGAGNISGCRFMDCEARRGGAVFAVDGIKLNKCHFTNCNVAEYGAAVFYSGIATEENSSFEYVACHPTGAEFVQVVSGRGELKISDEMILNKSTIIDCPVYVETKGSLNILNASLYLNYPIRCAGSIKMKNARIICNHLQDSDMLYLENAKQCEILNSEFDGALMTGGINVKGTKIILKNSMFRNMNGGRAVFNAYRPQIRECIFNFCQEGAIYTQGGEIEKCVFVNCRGKSGAGVLMYGRSGLVRHCNFKRCIADSGGGAVDRQIGQNVEKCLFEDCKPQNVS